MPVDFLTHEQEEKYCKFTEELSSEQLAKYFWLDDQDRLIIFRLRSAYNQLGFAIQLGTVRYLGAFLHDPTEISSYISRYVAQQLSIDPDVLSNYCNERTIRNHAHEICEMYGYHDFTDQPYHFRLIRWLYNHFWLSAERPSVLFEIAVNRCKEQKILLPGITVLERLVSEIRESANSRLWRKLSSLPDINQKNALEMLLVANNKNKTGMESFYSPVTHESPTGFLRAIMRFNTIYSIGAYQWNISKIPMGKIRNLSRYATIVRAQTIQRMSDDRRIAILASFAIVYTISSKDDVITYVEKYFSSLFNSADRKGKQERLRSLKDLDSSARELSKACVLLLDEKVSDEAIRQTIFSTISKDRLRTAIGMVDILTRPIDQNIEFKELFKHYTSVRRFLPSLLESIEFKASSAGQSALAAWNFLSDVENKTGKNKFVGAPTEGMSESWQSVVLKGDRISPCPYTFWAAEKMIEGIKNHDIYVENSDRYNDPRRQLLQGTAWEGAKTKVLDTLGWSTNAKESLTPLKVSLDTAFKETIKNWDNNPSVRVDIVKGNEKIILTNLDKLEEPRSLVLLRNRVDALMPNTDLPGLLLEIAKLTKFTDQFTHITQDSSRINDLHISICAVLIANACNIGLKALVHPGIPALEYDRLIWVEQNYFRNETLMMANAVLIEYLSKLALTKSWGSGNVASADGLRHVVPLKSIYAGSNPHYFGLGRGITSYNLFSDIFGGLNRLIITGTIRDSLYLLELVLGQQTILEPIQIMTDTAGYSDIIFGLFALLGYQFSPRIADTGESRLWRFDGSADYGVLNKFSKNKLREDLIIKYWDEMLRIAGSLKMATINPTKLIQMLQRSGKPTILGRAIGEFGRIYKTLYILKCLNDDNYRRDILTQLNRGETENGLERAVMYAKKGELYKSTREGQEDQLNALGLVSNAIVLWNTIYMEAALDAILAAGYVVNESDKKRLSPLMHGHITIIGKYSFNIPQEVLEGKLRPLQPMDKNLFGKIR